MLASLLFLVNFGAPVFTAAQAEEPAAVADSASWKHFGASFEDATKRVAVNDLMTDPAPYVGQTVRVQASISDVCQKAGCWMVIQDDKAQTMRVRMKDHAFAVDKDITGRTCEIEGVILAKPASPGEAAHFASEAAKPLVAPKGEGLRPTYEIEVSGVAVAPK